MRTLKLIWNKPLAKMNDKESVTIGSVVKLVVALVLLGLVVYMTDYGSKQLNREPQMESII